VNILESDKIKLRAPEPDDTDILYEWENDPEIWLVSNTFTPFSKYFLGKYIRNSHHDIYHEKQLRLMIELKENEKPIGTIDIFDFDPYHSRAGVGILISSKEDRNKGYASETLKLIINYLSEVLSLHQIYCNIPENNEASLKLFKDNGFKIVGEKKEWLKTSEGWISEYLLQLLC